MAAAKNKPNPRRANGSRRSNLRKRIKSLGLPCHLCGLPIDYSLPYLHPDAFVLDEIVPVSSGATDAEKARLATDPGNVGPAHRHCNQERGDMPMDVWRRYVRLKDEGMDPKQARKAALGQPSTAKAAASSSVSKFPTSRAW